MSEFLSNSRSRSTGRLIVISSAVGASTCLSAAFAQEAILPANQAPFQAPIVAAQQPAVDGEARDDNENFEAAPAREAASAPRGDVAPLPAQTGVSLEFQDEEVSEILMVISKAFNIPIFIQNDVTGRLKYLYLVAATPEEAIRKVITRSGNLKFIQEEDGTYVVGQNLSDSSANDTRNNASSGFNFTPWLTSPEQSPTGPSSPITQWQPGAGSGAGYTAPNFSENGLFNANPQKEASRVETRYYRVRNVRPGLIGWWLDSYSNPRPIEMLHNDRANRDSLNRDHPGRLVLPPEQQALKNGYYGGSGGGNPYINPYSDAQYSSNNSLFPGANNSFGGFPTYAQPGTQTLTNFQFGGRPTTTSSRQGGGGQFELPDGVEQVIAIDPQNALLVRGTPEGLIELENIIAFLDRPLRQVEIEAQFIDVSTDNLTDFGIDFSSTNGPFTSSMTGMAPAPAPAVAGNFQLGYVRNNFQATLTALIRSNRAKVVNAPRVTAINNLTASLSIQTATPVVLTDTVTGIGGQVGQNQNLILITTQIGLTVTPSINDDDTITVRMQPEVSLQTPPPPGVPAPGISTQTIDTVANVRDGDTIALGGLRTKTISVGSRRIPVLSRIPLLGALFRRNTDVEIERELIIFLTARIIRRPDDLLGVLQ